MRTAACIQAPTFPRFVGIPQSVDRRSGPQRPWGSDRLVVSWLASERARAYSLRRHTALVAAGPVSSLARALSTCCSDRLRSGMTSRSRSLWHPDRNPDNPIDPVPVFEGGATRHEHTATDDPSSAVDPSWRARHQARAATASAIGNATTQGRPSCCPPCFLLASCMQPLTRIAIYLLPSFFTLHSFYILVQSAPQSVRLVLGM
jgi:hypothetical protein